MTALNWVAMENGIENDPKLLSFARILKVKQETAFWYLYQWRVFVLQFGHHLTGALPKKYTARDLAAFVGFPGDPRRLVDAMKASGFLSFKKGCGFFYPGWKDTVTGGYAARRQEDRDRKANRVGRELPIAASETPVSSGRFPDIPRNVRTSVTEAPRSLRGTPEERNEESISDHPPDAPPAGGDLADARWEWLSKHAPTPQNREACKKLLVAISESDWGLAKRAYSLLFEGAYISKKDQNVLKWPTDRFLRQTAYLRFGVVDRPKRKAPRVSDPAALTAAADDLEQRLAASDDFVMELLRDPDQSDLAKADAKRRWAAVAENADRCPPWDTSGSAAAQNRGALS